MSSNEKYGLFRNIQSQKNALRFIKDVSTWLLFLSLVKFIMAFIYTPAFFFDAVVFGVCGFFLRKSHSLAAAITYLILTIISLILTFAKLAGAEWGENSWLPMVLLNFFISVKTIDTILKLRKNQFTSEVNENEALIPNPSFKRDA